MPVARPQLILLGRLAGSNQVRQRLVFLIGYPDRGQIRGAMAARQLRSVSPIRFHPTNSTAKYGDGSSDRC